MYQFPPLVFFHTPLATRHVLTGLCADAAMDVTQVLVAAQSPDPSVRQQAEQQIEAAKTTNLVRVRPLA